MSKGSPAGLSKSSAKVLLMWTRVAITSMAIRRSSAPRSIFGCKEVLLDNVFYLWVGLPAFRIIAARALIAAFDADQRRLAAFRTLRHAGRGRSLIGDHGAPSSNPLLADCGPAAPRRQKADLDHVALD